jgi:hypothetical protein
MFYLIEAATNDVVEGGKLNEQRPPWLGDSHVTQCWSVLLEILRSSLSGLAACVTPHMYMFLLLVCLAD